MNHIKTLIRKIVPEEVISWWHWIETATAALLYGFPSRKMVIIGVTGSKGKTTTSNMIWAALASSGEKVGQTGTANIRIGEQESLNPYHMTMPGRWYLQKIIKQMADDGCTYAVIETPSEGQKHYRHAGINYDVLVFTNLTDEHLPIHHNNSFEQLKIDNARVYRKLNRMRRKTINDHKIPKTIIVNADAKDSPYYMDHPADRHASFAVEHKADYQAQSIKATTEKTEFTIKDQTYTLPILGRFNVINATGAVAVATELNIPSVKIALGLAKLDVIPGRMEVIDEGQPFTVIVDYAHEQVGMELLLKSITELKSDKGRIIVHLGAEGGGRDSDKRPIMGKIAGKLAQIVIIGNVDPYYDDPAKIISDIAAGAVSAGKTPDKDLFCIEDRREGIRKALSLAESDDIVLITGKGAEQSYIAQGTKTPWDDRLVVREELKKIHNHLSKT